MPELPEVEVTRRSFATRIQGARIMAARFGLPLRWPLGIAPDALIGRTVQGVGRRGKYLLMSLDEGVLLLHLGMSGRLVFGRELASAGRHDHMDLETTQGTLRLHDPRRFGAVVWTSGLDVPPASTLLHRLGVEPLSDAFEPRAFHAALRLRRAAIKQVLLAGDVVVGVGNIYANEALYLAGIHPLRSAGRISQRRYSELHDSIRGVLTRAIAQGGTTLRDFVGGDGKPGYFSQSLNVYGRGGEDCPGCGAVLREVRLGQRTTVYCGHCQR